MAKDFIEPNGDIYHNNISGHGTSVLSCMAAYLPNLMVGAAPKASYCLFRTEDTSSEYLIEEYTWVIGAEVADSIGADLINSSLSYTKYDDPSMSHQYSDMDGKTTIASIGAREVMPREYSIGLTSLYGVKVVAQTVKRLVDYLHLGHQLSKRRRVCIGVREVHVSAYNLLVVGV